MRTVILLLVIVCLAVCFGAESASRSRAAQQSPTGFESPANSIYSSNSSQANSLCAKNEHIIFSCAVKRTAKIVSLCASSDLAKERGYLQYRFGLPEKIELEFPKDRQGTQQKFRYSHYFRFQVDLTEITFEVNGYEYSVFDTYNGEEKPAISEQGVSVKAPGKPKEVSFVCRSKPKADYSALSDVLSQGQE